MGNGRGLLYSLWEPMPVWLRVVVGCGWLILCLCLWIVSSVRGQSQAIHEAVRRGDVREIEQILDEHPDWIESQFRNGGSPLHTAAWSNSTEALTLLIRRGANVNSPHYSPASSDGRWTPLHVAVWSGHAVVADVLLKAGASVNALTLKGETPLDIALRYRRQQLATLIQGYGGVRGGELRKVAR